MFADRPFNVSVLGSGISPDIRQIAFVYAAHRKHGAQQTVHVCIQSQHDQAGCIPIQPVHQLRIR